MSRTKTETLTWRLRNGLVALTSLPWPAVGMLTLIATWLRLADLGDIAMRPDELNGWGVWIAGSTLRQIMSGEVTFGGDPMPLVLAMALVKGLGLGLTFFTYRLFPALIGALTVPLAYGCGNALAGRRMGFAMALLLALNPVHVQCSREMYPYVLIVAGAYAMVWANLKLWQTTLPPPRHLAVALLLTAFGLLFLLYSAVTGWPFAFLAAAALAVGTALHAKSNRCAWWLLIAIALVCTALGGPKAVPYVSRLLESGAVEKTSIAALHKDPVPLFSMKELRFVTNFAWGLGPVRTTFSLLVAGLGVAALARRFRDRRTWLVFGLLAIGYLVTSFMRYKTGNMPTPRFLIVLLPLYTLILAHGLCLTAIPDRWLRGARGRAAAVAAVVGIAVALWAQPLAWAVQSRGIVPLTHVVDWADANLPPGTPILCDRYFTAWNEYRWNPSTNVVFMSTIPNQHPQQYEQGGWRESAIRFLLQNPDAAYHEERINWNWFGPWTWPHEFFAHKEVFVDEPIWNLLQVGLSYRRGGETDITRDDISRTIYYNTRADAVARERERGDRLLAVLDSGWRYFKARNYLDLRVMDGETAFIDLYLLADEPDAATLTLSGVASGGAKTLRVNGRPFSLPANQPVSLPIPGIPLQPGRNRIPIQAANPNDGVPFLLIELKAELARNP